MQYISFEGLDLHMLTKRINRQSVLPLLGLAAILALGAFLRLYHLGAYSIGNAYYAATVKSMLTSWHNFFYASFEPGGSVSVDKPPLGFWVQALFAYFLGVNGFALALPQALAGVLSIAVLYHLVRRHFGVKAGLAAALVLAVFPITVATERNNTIDGQLVLVLLLAAWAFLKAAESGKIRHLLLGAFLVGVGFNIKMLQAFMPLPAFYLVYLLSARHRWWQRVLHLVAATAVLLVVSLAWAVAVDLTPPDKRPYVGSSTNNTVMELIIGHNGLRRLGLMKGGPGPGDDRRPVAGRDANGIPQNDGAGQPAGGPPPSGLNSAPGGNAPRPFPGGAPPNAAGGPPAGGRPGGSNEVGNAGVLRLFQEPLVTEASWMLPWVLIGFVLALVAVKWAWPLGEKERSVLLWAGWLLPSLAYFSFTTGLFHRYYLIMLGPPVAALSAIVLWSVDHQVTKRPTLGWLLLAFLSGINLLFEIYVLRHYPTYAGMVTVASVLLWLAGLGTLAAGRWRPALRSLGLALALAAMLVAPFVWSLLTTLNPRPNVALPTAGPSQTDRSPVPFMRSDQQLLTPYEQAVLAYTLAHTDPEDYLLATDNAHGAAPFILATGRPVLTFGGFIGSDDVVSLEELQAMIAAGKLRFILGLPQKPAIARWIQASCSVVPGFEGASASGNAFPSRGGLGGRAQNEVLYDCGG